MCHAAAVNLATQYRQFLDKNFGQYLIICSPGVEHVSESEDIYSSDSNKLSIMLYNIQGGIKERMFLNLPAISFFGVTSNQKSTFENLV